MPHEPPSSPTVTPALVGALIAQGRAAEALRIAEQSVRASPRDPAWLHVFGYALHANGASDRALEAIAAAIALAPSEAVFHNTSGAIALESGRLELAQAHFQEALRLNPTYAEARYNVSRLLLQRSKLLIERGEAYAAKELLEDLLKDQPGDPDVLLNLAAATHRLGDLKSARTYSADGARHALARQPRDSAALARIAQASLAGGDLPTAADALREQLRYDPPSRSAAMMLGSVLHLMGDRVEARDVVARAVDGGLDDAEALSTLAIFKSLVCDWQGMEELVDRARTRARVPSAFPADPQHAIYLEGVSATEQKAWALNWAAVKWPRYAAPAPASSARGGRLRVGFLSRDYRVHPTARLLAAMVEEHDRERFEFVAYAFGPHEPSEMRSRLERAFDRLVDLDALSDAKAAHRIAADGIDVLLDMGGHVQGSRLGILAHRPAPLQGHFLGYPGTTGAPFVDFFVSDAVATPSGAEAHFTERVLRMPASCQPNDPRRPIAAAPPRSACGLKEDAVVLCSFNQPIKITRTVFEGWCGLLQGFPRACLWLLDFDPVATRTLRATAERLGVDPGRLVFAPRIGPEEHLARLANADLALDTFPCTSHTTASDMLWAGVPLITARGDTFASRMAASVLTAAGLSDWCFDDPAAANAAILAMAASPAALAEARRRVEAARGSPLFDAAAFARAFEVLLENELRRS